MSIVVEQLSKSYGDQIAVNNLSFEARSGRILGLLGPNGAGKSSTMRMITGYMEPSGGCIFIEGKELKREAVEVKRQIGYLPENTPLYADMYVREFLTFVGQTYGLKRLKKRVDDIIEQVGLSREQHKKIHMLSKGYKQRVGLAQAIIHDPKVLVLDEPTSGMDPNQLSDIRQLIKQLAENKTIILSTHIMQEVEAICEDVIVIHHGKMIASAPIEELKALHQTNSLEEVFKALTTS